MSAYFDHAATTPLCSEALEAMLPHLTTEFGNPSGMHAYARRARKAIEDARETIAFCMGADSSEVVFTGGGTESDNAALMGAFASRTGSLVCSAIEHHAVLRCAESLGGVVVRVDANGIIDLDELESVLDSTVSVVSVMQVNNEVGTIQPIHKVKRLIEKKSPNALLHTDAIQATSWLDVARMTQFADLVSISAHKFGGPQGVGALVIRKGVKISPLLIGGGQERERRGGTQNVAGIVGMAAALAATTERRSESIERVSKMRDQLVDGLLLQVDGAFETGDRTQKIVSNAHLCFPGIESETLLILLDQMELYASAGASCSSGAMEPSHVLLAMGMDSKAAKSSLRLSLGYTTVASDIEFALDVIPKAVERLRKVWV